MTPHDTRLPDVIKLTTTVDGRPAGGLLVLVTLRMGRKNDFDVVVGPSDSDGRLRVTGEELRGEIDQTIRLFPMDYHDPDARDGFTGQIELLPMAAGDLSAALAAYDLYSRVAPYPAGYVNRLTEALKRVEAIAPARIDLAVDATDGPVNGVQYHTISRPVGAPRLSRPA